MIYSSSVVTWELAMGETGSGSMKKSISKVSGTFFVIVMLFVFASWKYNEISSHITEISEIDVSGITVLFALTVMASAVGFALIHFKTYEAIDNIFFKARRKTDQYICTYIRNEAEATLGRKVSATDDELMYIFYFFVNRKDKNWSTLWNMAFDEWTDYWISMNLIVISVMGVSLETLLIRYAAPHIAFALVVAVFLGVLAVLLWFNSQYCIRPRLIPKIAKPQLIMITKNFRAEFDTTVRERFGE